jgi:chromosomal replication initiation ATPase DnaA
MLKETTIFKDLVAENNRLKKTVTKRNLEIIELKSKLYKSYKLINEKERALLENKISDSIEDSDFANSVKNYINLFFNTDISIRDRIRRRIEARSIFYLMMRKYTDTSLQVIATYVGHVHHSTILHGIDMANDLIETDRTFRKNLASVEEYVKNNILPKINQI